MASTFVNDLRLNEMATGDQSGSWGTVTNTNLELIGEALGFGTQQVFGSDANATTTVADGAADPARAMYFRVTSAGNLTATRTMTVAPDTVSRLMFIENATSGSQSIAVKQGSGSGAAVTIPTGLTKVVYLDGAGSGAAVVDAFAALSVVDLLVDDDLTVTDDLVVGGLVTIGETLAVTGVLTTTAATVFNGGFASNADSTMGTNKKLIFRDSAIHISSTADGDLSIAADDEIDITSTLIDVNGNLDVSGTALVTGVLTTTAATVFNGGFAAGGVGTFADGSVGAPSITNTGDLNTGMFFPAADTIGFATASKTLLTLTETVADFNPSGINIDFRVRSDGNDSMLFVDGGDDQVRIGRSADVDGFNLVVGTTTAAGAIAIIGRADDISQVIFYEADASTTIGKIDARNSLLNFGSVANVPVGIIVNNSQMATFGAEHLTIGNGNLIIGTSGHGIDFTAADSGATGASGNLLDDYEEGVCTLTWSGSGGTANSTNTGFKYVKVGNLVSINGATATALPNATGSLELTGLPFAANGDAAGSILYRNVTAPSNMHTLIAYVGSTATAIRPFWASAAAYTRLDDGDFNVDGHQDFYLSLNYRST